MFFSFSLSIVMVLTLDGNSETGAHVGSNLCYLICLRHFFIESNHKYDFFPEKTFFPSFVRNMF